MMIRRLAERLVAAAARRWSNHDEMQREWSAELHELAAHGRRAEMLRFAFSLAVSRPGNPGLDRRFWGTASALLFAAPLAVVLWVVSGVSQIIVSEDVFDKWIGEWAFWLSETARYVTMLAFAIVLAVMASRWARRSLLRSPLLLAVAVIVPVVPILLFVVDSMGNMWRLDRAFPELFIWPSGMLLTLWVAGRVARRGQAWMAWGVGILGAFVTAQLAIMSVMTHVTTPVDWSSSSLWLVSYFNYRSQMVNDVVSPTPDFYLMVTPYALAYVLSAVRQSAPRRELA